MDKTQKYSVYIENAAKLIVCIFFIWLFILFKAIPPVNSDFFVCMAMIVLCCFMVKDTSNALLLYIDTSKKKITKNTITLFFLSAAISFCIGGNYWFYDEKYGIYETSAHGIIAYISIILFSMLLCLNVNYWMSKATVTEKGHSKYFKYIIAFIFLSSGSLYLIAYNPANMFPDTYMQLRQVWGIDQYYDWHPVFHTLLLKAFLNICNTPAFFAFSHIVFFAYVMTLWMIKLNEKGIREVVLILYSCTFYFNVAYGVLITNIWKDNLYNILLVYLTYLLYCFFDNYEKFHEKKANYILLFFCTMAIGYIRHNGVISTFLIICLLVLKGFKDDKDHLFVIGVMMFIFFIIAKPIAFDILEARENDNGIKYIPIVHDVAAILVYNDGTSLSDNVRNEMFSIITLDQWKRNYNSCDSDDYTFHVTKFMPGLNSKSVGKMLGMYADAFFHEPVRLVSARLMSSQLMWSMFKRNGTTDYLYEKTNTAAIEENFEYRRVENNLTVFANKMYDFFEDSVILNTLFYRTGIWFILLLILVFVSYINTSTKSSVLVLLPIVGNILALLLTMTCQHLRYVWAIFIVAIIYFLLIVAESHKKSNLTVQQNIKHRQKLKGSYRK